MAESTTVLIVGAGLAGLRLADLLTRRGVPFRLIEARTRTGGRITTEEHSGSRFDLGPAWFWQGQPRILSLIDELELRTFEQYATGDLLYEDEAGRVQRGVGFASMQGSLRLAGGLSELTDKLAARIGADRLSIGTEVTGLDFTGQGVTAFVRTQTGECQINAKTVVLALPPRLVAESISFEPALPPAASMAMENTSTWMAGQAKVLAIYDTPLWREAGLSGDAVSRRGPMVEIHDASPVDSGPFALFGFVGVPVSGRKDEERLKDAAVAQLGRLFGPQALTPSALHLKDWAFDPYTATQLDHVPLTAHPNYRMPDAINGLYDGRLLFGSTEVGGQFGGYLEGALEAAENAAAALEAASPAEIDPLTA